MSCMMLSSRHLAAVSEGLCFILRGAGGMYDLVAPDCVRDAFRAASDGMGFYSSEKVFEALYSLNCRAYAGRYRQEPTGKVPDFPSDCPFLLHRLEWTGRDKEDARGWALDAGCSRFVKLLECLLYQVEEDATRNDPLTSALRCMLQAFRSWLLSNTPEYCSAAWTI